MPPGQRRSRRFIGEMSEKRSFFRTSSCIAAKTKELSFSAHQAGSKKASLAARPKVQNKEKETLKLMRQREVFDARCNVAKIDVLGVDLFEVFDGIVVVAIRLKSEG